MTTNQANESPDTRNPRSQSHVSKAPASSPSPAQSKPVQSSLRATPERVVCFEDLAQGDKVVVIDFQGNHYRLRLTKSGRLVLTK